VSRILHVYTDRAELDKELEAVIYLLDLNGVAYRYDSELATVDYWEDNHVALTYQQVKMGSALFGLAFDEVHFPSDMEAYKIDAVKRKIRRN